IFYNIIFAFSGFPMGALGDKLGLKKTFIIGLILFAIVYFGFAFVHGMYWFLALFFLYGLYAAATDGISKAWISNISDKRDTATAIGTYTGLQSICALIASSGAGFIWFKFGASAVFALSGIATLFCILYFFIYTKKEEA